MTKEQTIEYAKIQADKKALELREAELKSEILAFMLEKDADKIETEVGTFSLGKRKSWTYPQSVIEIVADLQVAKKTAEAKGDATYVETPYFIFKGIK
jgi:hypothetical protein